LLIFKNLTPKSNTTKAKITKIEGREIKLSKPKQC